MKRPIKCPNLPETSVCDVAVSGKSPKLLKKLTELNINAIITKENTNLDDRVSSHTDMLINNISEGLLLGDSSQRNNIVKFLTIGYEYELTGESVKSPYPCDSLLNAASAGGRIICNPHTVDKKVIEYAESADMKIISVKQGYTKCSVCFVAENALITDDESIYNACAENEIDSLLISKGSVKLNGFDYGFIGGCTGLIDKNKLLFNGDLNYHNDCNKIVDFLKKYAVEPVIIENQPLYDIGGILPLTEKTCKNQYFPLP